MEFSSLTFLYLFLPLTLVVYFLMPDIRKKNIVLIVASLLFFSMAQPLSLVFLLASAALNFWLGQRVQPGNRRSVLLPVCINIALLALYKYLDFLLGSFGVSIPEGGLLLSAQNGITSWINQLFGSKFAMASTVVPIGLSFYTFQVIAYQVDIYRQKHQAQRLFSLFLLYVSMFPKLLQGPIVRYEQIESQLTDRRAKPKAAFNGAWRFVLGLAKKVLIADYAGKVCVALKADSSGAAVWLTALMFMFQVYFDFSGYSDMAIGLGKIFGFRYCENFDLPYTSTSITEFWRRWHMSLGSFFRDYVYIPLGGNRKGKPRQILNLLVVWALTGLWHGASWNFVLWGLYFFVLLTIEKQLMPKLERLPRILRNLLTMLCVLIGWVFFYYTSAPALWKALGALFFPAKFWSPTVGVQLRNSLLLILLAVLGSSPLPRTLGNIWRNALLPMGRRERSGAIRVKPMIYALGSFAIMVLLLWLCTVSMVGTTSAPSIYASF